MTQSSTAPPWSVTALASGVLLLVGALGLGLGSDRAEKVLSIASSVAGVSGAAIGMVALLRARTAPDSPPDATGVVRSAAAEPAADMASLTGRWRNSGGTVGNAGPLQITEQDAVLTVDRTGRF